MAVYHDKRITKSVIFEGLVISVKAGRANPLASFLVLHFCAPKSHKPKNWLYNACLEKSFPSLRSDNPIKIKLLLY